MRAALQLGLFQLLFLDGVAAHAAIGEAVELAKPSPGHRARQRRAAPRPARGRRAALRRDARGRGDPPLAPASGSSTCGGTGSAPTRRARCWRPTTSPPSSRCASTRSSTTTSTTSPGAARATRSSSTGRSTRSPIPATRRARSRRSRAPASSWRRALDPQPGERVLDLCAAPGRQDDAPRGADGGHGRGRGGRAPPAARPRAAGDRRAHAGRERHASSSADANGLRRRRRLRPRPARPAVLAGSGRCARTPICAGARAPRRSSGWPPSRTRCWPPARRALAPRRDARLLGLHALAAEERLAATDAVSAPSRTTTAPTASILPAMEADLGLAMPVLRGALAAAVEPRRALPLRVLPAPLRAALGLPELRRALDDRAHVEHGHPHLQPLRRLDARRGMTRRDRPLDPGRRLRPPARAGRRPSSTPAPTVIHVDVMDGHFVPHAHDGAAGVVEALRDFDVLLDVHLMIERPERHVADFAAAGADNITVHAEATPHVALRRAAHPRGRVHRGRRAHARRRRWRRCREVARRPWSALCMTVNPGWGGQEFIPASLDKIAPPAGARGRRRRARGRRRHRRATPPARAPRRARRSSSPEPPCSGPRTPGQPSAELASAVGCS